jgi:hypothetical protein
MEDMNEAIAIALLALTDAADKCPNTVNGKAASAYLNASKSLVVQAVRLVDVAAIDRARLRVLK